MSMAMVMVMVMVSMQCIAIQCTASQLNWACLGMTYQAGGLTRRKKIDRQSLVMS